MRQSQLPLLLEVPPRTAPDDGLRMDGVVVPHLGAACKTARLAANHGKGVKLVRIAAALDRSESTLSNFEKGKVQPDHVDRVVAAYAAELEISALELWADALKLASEEGIRNETRPAGDLRDAPLFAEPERRTQSAPPEGKRTPAARRRAS